MKRLLFVFVVVVLCVTVCAACESLVVKTLKEAEQEGRPATCAYELRTEDSPNVLYAPDMKDIEGEIDALKLRDTPNLLCVTKRF